MIIDENYGIEQPEKEHSGLLEENGEDDKINNSGKKENSQEKKEKENSQDVKEKENGKDKKDKNMKYHLNSSDN